MGQVYSVGFFQHINCFFLDQANTLQFYLDLNLLPYVIEPAMQNFVNFIKASFVSLPSRTPGVNTLRGTTISPAIEGLFSFCFL